MNSVGTRSGAFWNILAAELAMTWLFVLESGVMGKEKRKL
jgi:hypothetical protein